MPSVDRGVQRELKVRKPNFQQIFLSWSRAARAHTQFRAQNLLPGVSVLNVKPWPWTRAWALASKRLLGFFCPDSGSRSLGLKRNPAIGPRMGWSSARGWDMKPQWGFGYFRSKCEFRWSEEFSDVVGDVARWPFIMWPRGRGTAISQISQYLGKDFNVTQVQILYVNFLVDPFS